MPKEKRGLPADWSDAESTDDEASPSAVRQPAKKRAARNREFPAASNAVQILRRRRGEQIQALALRLRGRVRNLGKLFDLPGAEFVPKGPLDSDSNPNDSDDDNPNLRGIVPFVFQGQHPIQAPPPIENASRFFQKVVAAADAGNETADEFESDDNYDAKSSRVTYQP